MTFVTVPYGIISIDRQLAVLRRLPSGVEEIDLRTGEQLWGIEINGLPLAFGGGQILARDFDAGPQMLGFLLLAASDGRMLRCTAPVTLPWWVDTRDSGFELMATTNRTEFLIDWSARRRYRGGAPPRHEVDGVVERVSGCLRVDFAGHVLVGEPRAPIEPRVESEPIAIGKNQYQVTPEAVLEARDTTSNRVLWRRSLGGPIQERPPLPQ